MNQRQSCLSDYSRNFAEFWPLANGSRPIYAAVVFGHADFADDADFSSWDYFVPQISQIYTDFFHRKVFHRISRMNQKAFLLIGLLTEFRRILAAGQWLAPYICSCCFFCHADFADDADFSSWDYFVPQISQIYTDFFESQANRFFRSQGVSATTGQVASAKFRVIR